MLTGLEKVRDFLRKQSTAGRRNGDLLSGTFQVLDRYDIYASVSHFFELMPATGLTFNIISKPEMVTLKSLEDLLKRISSILDNEHSKIEYLQSSLGKSKDEAAQLVLLVKLYKAHLQRVIDANRAVIPVQSAAGSPEAADSPRRPSSAVKEPIGTSIVF